jgi:hypothetical protein
MLRWALLTIGFGLLETWVKVFSALIDRSVDLRPALVSDATSGALFFFATGLTAETASSLVEKTSFLVDQLRVSREERLLPLIAEVFRAQRRERLFFCAVVLGIAMSTTIVVVEQTTSPQTVDLPMVGAVSTSCAMFALYANFLINRENANDLEN